ncbi:MAG: gliding motility-associated C-terminal domain-containing protein [Opitutaceae bacterium]|nr:gliding motility-associated C-terminal domain-containing protein [Cytophagales bacterium]
MKRIFIILIFLYPGLTRSEGTRELKPNPSSKGNLLLLKGYTKFGMYGATSKEQIKIRIADLSEKIYYGLSNKNGLDQFGVNNDNGVFVPNIPFRIRAPSGLVVYSSVIPSSGIQGNISSYGQAVAGPLQLGNAGGYDALEYQPLETGDYVIEFDPVSKNIVRLNLPFFDVTVVNSVKVPQKGRLHCQGWQISTESYTNPFDGKVYPYDGSTSVYEVDFNGMQPWVFVINFNSTGTSKTGNFLEDRVSKIGNYTFAEYEVFLNPPDAVLYPTEPKKLEMNGSVEKVDCLNSQFCLNFTTNSEGLLQGFIDLNQDHYFDTLDGDIYFEKTITSPGTVCIPWNGKDSKGKLVKGQFNISAALAFGVTHLPLYDVEHNVNGYKVKVIRPAGATPPVIFWDDSRITEGTALDGSVNLAGCLSSATTGCHRWKDRGSINDPAAYDKQETINTWWYSTITTTSLLNANPSSHDVKLSFDPSLLSKKDTTVCKGDIVDFYVFKDGVNHFNPTKFQYNWFVDGTPMTDNLRMQSYKINKATEIIVKATDRFATSCISYDTLHALVVDPVKLTASVTEPPCNNATGSITILLTEGTPNKKIYWTEFPGNSYATQNNLQKGTYHIKGMDPKYPRCAADTAITLNELNGVSVDSLEIKSTSCNSADGSANLRMKDLTKIYEYSWNGSSFGNGSSISGLNIGNYSVKVREKGTVCEDSRPFVIKKDSPDVKISSINELCQNGKGEINVILPDNNFNVTYNNIPGGISKVNLSAGNYLVKAVSTVYPGCVFDTAIKITNTSPQFSIKNLNIVSSNCYTSTGSAEIVMPAGNYLFSLNSGSFSTAQKWLNLGVGKYQIKIKDIGSGCIKDTSFELKNTDLSFTYQSSPDLCYSGKGSVKVNLKPGQRMTWQDTSSTTSGRYHLHSKSYTFTVSELSNPLCKTEKTVKVRDSVYTLKANFSFRPVSATNNGVKSMKFTNLSYGYVWSGWQFGDGKTSTEKDPVHEYISDGSFQVKLVVMDSFGCSGRVQRRFLTSEVFDNSCGIALPNVFSPNGDLQNDDIGILGWAPVVELKIFNRWGEVVFRATEIPERWNGTYRNEESPIDVYPYILNWQCPDGNGGMTKNQKVADITLVR